MGLKTMEMHNGNVGQSVLVDRNDFFRRKSVED